jgi:hypothetical protein
LLATDFWIPRDLGRLDVAQLQFSIVLIEPDRGRCDTAVHDHLTTGTGEVTRADSL